MNVFGRCSMWAIGAAMCLIGLNLGGCAGNTDLIEANRALTDRNQALVQENESLRNANAALQAGLSSRDRTISEQKRLIDDLLASRNLTQEELARLSEQLSGMRFGDLDPATDSALQALAAQYPELFVYDSETGMLRFKSDLTFDSGSDVVKSEARSALGQLATILNGPAAQYDIRVVGHTDAQRVRQVAGRRFKDNLELSAFRSISVRNVLVGAGVAATRVEFAGRGEFDPIVPNTAGSGNTQENRRVEMFLVRPLRRGVPAPSGDMGGGDAPSAPAPKEEFMK